MHMEKNLIKKMNKLIQRLLNIIQIIYLKLMLTDAINDTMSALAPPPK